MIIVYFDGCCEPINPGGYGGFGVYIIKDDIKIKEISGFIEKRPDVSNNVAEYKALISALEWLLEENYKDDVVMIKGDSQLVINQMMGLWRIKSGLYTGNAFKARELAEKFSKIKYQWIPREANIFADELSKKELHNHKVNLRIQND